MPADREAVMTALYDLAVSAAGFKSSGRDLAHWSATVAQPALYVVDGEEDMPADPYNMPRPSKMAAELWIYTKGEERPDNSRPKALNALLDAIEAAFRPDPVTNVQDLGGVVENCWIEGQIFKAPGHTDGQAVAVIPIVMIVPR
jgi:hypothetical protein